MNDFWNNVSRYPRFFISSLVGLLLVILAPLRNLFKVAKLRNILILVIFMLLILIYLVIKSMLGL